MPRPATKLYATLTVEGTSMYEIVLTEAEYNDPAERAKAEKQAMKIPDSARPIVWADVTENEAFWNEED